MQHSVVPEAWPAELADVDLTIGPNYEPTLVKAKGFSFAGELHHLTMRSQDSTIYPGIVQKKGWKKQSSRLYPKENRQRATMRQATTNKSYPSYSSSSSPSCPLRMQGNKYNRVAIGIIMATSCLPLLIPFSPARPRRNKIVLLLLRGYS